MRNDAKCKIVFKRMRLEFQRWCGLKSVGGGRCQVEKDSRGRRVPERSGPRGDKAEVAGGETTMGCLLGTGERT
jgi:hypothetical protein